MTLWEIIQVQNTKESVVHMPFPTHNGLMKPMLLSKPCQAGTAHVLGASWAKPGLWHDATIHLIHLTKQAIR